LTPTFPAFKWTLPDDWFDDGNTPQLAPMAFYARRRGWHYYPL